MPWFCLNFQWRGVLLIWIIVRYGPIALAVGAGEVVWTVFSRLPPLSDGPIETKILSQVAFKPNETNQSKSGAK